MKKLLLKTMLICMMLSTTNAMAETKTLLAYGTPESPWSNSALTEWTVNGTLISGPTITDNYVTISGGNNSSSMSVTTTPTESTIISVKAVWRGSSNTGRDFEKGNGSFFRFGNIVVAQNDHNKSHGYTFNGLDDMANVAKFSAGSYRVDITESTWLLIEMEINTASNTLTSFSVKSEDGATTYASASNIALTDADYTTVEFGYHKVLSVTNSNVEQLKSVKVTETTQAVQTANYTVRYVCDGKEVKEASTRKGIVGQSVILFDQDTENFYATDGSMKYIYVSNDAESRTVSEGEVITVTFRQAERYDWTAKAIMGSQTGYTTSGWTWEGDKASVPYPRYQLLDGKLWEKKTTNKEYRQSFDITENNQEFILDYTETEIDNVKFLAEVEDIEGMGIVDYGNAAARCSQCAAGYSKSGTTPITTLPFGKYKMTADFYSPTSAGGEYNFLTGTRNIWSITTPNSNTTIGEQEVVLVNQNNQILLDATNAAAAIDYIYIQYVGMPTKEEIAEAMAEPITADEIKLVTFVNDAGWDNVYVWAWNDYENFTGGSWPGEKLTANGEGKYVWLTLGEPTKILFNDGGSDQTADLDFVDEGVYNSTGCINSLNSYTVTFINDAGWDNVYVWAWNDDENFTGGSWPGEKLTANGEGNYVWSTQGEPTKILFNDGGSDQTADLDFVDGGVYNSTGCINSLNSYTVTFKTNLVWESVYAYAWSGDGDTAVKFLGDWPGTKVTDVDDSHDDYDIYTLTFEAATAPEKIIFSNGVGGKVGRTQTADLEFVDGKEYSLIYVPSALMEHARELAESADEGEALNKLLEAIQYAFENDDESQLQAAIDQFIADTEKANYFIEFSAGKYYIIDAETGMMMAAGGSFGTHGIVNERGLDLWLTPYTESRTVTIDSHVSGGGNSHFLSQNLFMDSEEWGWGLVYQGFGFYIKDPNSGKYINIDEDNNLVLSDTPREWIIVSAEGVREQRMEELADATIDNPVDATFLITAPNFNRNDQRNAEAWNVSGDCTLSTGNEVNNCAESLHSTFTISQTLAGAPKGTYQLTAQGFYRQDDGASEAAPQFFIGSEMVQLPKLTGSEANASDASASFTNGLYTIDPITFYYDGTGDLTIGIQGTAEHQWVVFDNFCLTYLEPEKYEVYTEFVEATGTLTYYYDDKMASRSGITEVYDPVGNPDAVRFTGYYNKVTKAVIDPSMKNANLTSMYSMFFGGINNETFAFQTLSKMTEIKGMENLNTADVTRMDFMFEACNALQTVDVNSFDISKVTKMDFMFGDCYELTTIYCSKDWSSTSASSDNMFGTCRKLVGGNGTAFDSNVTNATYARPDGGTERPGYFTAVLIEGDLNGDGKVDIADAVAVLEVMAKDGNDPEADLNGDGKVDIADFVAVLEIMAKQ